VLRFLRDYRRTIRRPWNALLQPAPDEEDCQYEAKSEMPRALWHTLRVDPGRTSLDTMLEEIAKLEHLRALELPPELFAGVPRRVLHVYRQRAVVEESYELRRHPASLRLTLLAAFSVLRMQEITDTLVDLLLEIVHPSPRFPPRKAEVWPAASRPANSHLESTRYPLP
jgi:hypothetical protein